MIAPGTTKRRQIGGNITLNAIRSWNPVGAGTLPLQEALQCELPLDL